MASRSTFSYKVLASEVAIVEADHETPAPRATAGYSTFCFDILVAGAKFSGFQFQNSACSHIAVFQDRGGSWFEVLPWTPLLLHDYRDELELEAWHFVPVSMFSSDWEVETMCRLRIHVQYRTSTAVQAHQLRHVRCLREDLPTAAGAAAAPSTVDAAAIPMAGGDEDPSGMRHKVADRAMLLSELLAASAPAALRPDAAPPA